MFLNKTKYSTLELVDILNKEFVKYLAGERKSPVLIGLDDQEIKNINTSINEDLAKNGFSNAGFDVEEMIAYHEYNEFKKQITEYQLDNNISSLIRFETGAGKVDITYHYRHPQLALLEKDREILEEENSLNTCFFLDVISKSPFDMFLPVFVEGKISLIYTNVDSIYQLIMDTDLKHGWSYPVLSRHPKNKRAIKVALFTGTDDSEPVVNPSLPSETLQDPEGEYMVVLGSSPVLGDLINQDKINWLDF